MSFNGTSRKSEVIDLSETEDNKCFDWVEPIYAYQATSGLIGTSLVICGGYYKVGLR